VFFVKSDTWDEGILADHRSSIKEEAGRGAFDTLVAAGIAMPAYQTEPAWQGEVRIFKYVDSASGERPFAFIVNKKDLLFYVREKGLGRVPGGFPALKQQFSTAAENKRGEWTVRIASREDAQRLNSFLFSYPHKSVRQESGIPDGIRREDVLGAIKRLDAGVEHGFGPSLKYDLIFEGHRYPPKAVIGLAAERLAGRVLGPGDFSGGESSKSTRILGDLGFQVKRKNIASNASQSISPSSRAPRSFTQYWKNTTLDWHESDELEHTASNQFTKRGVRAGDHIFIVTVADGKMHLGGVLVVDKLLTKRAAQKIYGKEVWDATDHVLDRQPRPFYKDLVVPMRTVRALRFEGNKALAFKTPGQLDTQTLRGVRELTPKSAELLQDILRFAREQELEQKTLFPNELESGVTYSEGARKQVVVNAFERDPKARRACLDHHGYDCAVCGFNFEANYGERGKGFIHVHHLKPMSLTDGEYALKPVTDLRPVCPNCHAMLHRGERVLSIEELREILTQINVDA
jgi:HNH endonuclease